MQSKAIYHASEEHGRLDLNGTETASLRTAGEGNSRFSEHQSTDPFRRFSNCSPSRMLHIGWKKSNTDRN
jgi:L-rhamnose isomerase